MVKHDMTCDPLQCQNVPDLFMDFFRSQKKSSVHWSLAPGIQHLGCSLIWPNDMWRTWDICDTRSDQNIHVCWFVEDLFLLEFNVCWFTYVHMVHNPMFFFQRESESIRINIHRDASSIIPLTSLINQPSCNSKVATLKLFSWDEKTRASRAMVQIPCAFTKEWFQHRDGDFKR